MKILINTFGIQDSGGITVLEKLLQEIQNSSFYYLIVCTKNDNILNLIVKYGDIKNLEFMVVENKGFLHRLYYENIVFRKLIKEKVDKNNNGKSEKLIPIKRNDILISFKLTVGSMKIYNSDEVAYCNEAIDILTIKKECFNKYIAFICMFFPAYSLASDFNKPSIAYFIVV